MKTKKLLFLTLSFLAFTFSVNAQRGVRIGYIDMEYILENVPEYQEASTQLDGKVQRWKKEIEKKGNEIKKMKLNLSSEKALLTTELIEEREEDIKILENELIEYKQARFGPNGDLFIQRKQLVQPIQDQVFNIVQEVAEKKKYDFIFDKSADIVMLFAAKRNDISDIVLRSINRTAKRKQAKTKREKKEITQRDNLSLEEDNEVTQREQAIENKKNEREKQMEERKRVRDSIRAAKKAEYDARRQKLLDERQKRKDSILNAKESKNKTSSKTINENIEEEGAVTAEEEKGAVEENKSKEQQIADKKRVRDSIRAAKKAENEARRQKIIEERQRRKDSILEARKKKSNPSNTNENEEEDNN